MNQQDRIRYTRGDAPIYDKLVAERGDIPAQVNTEAARILKDAERSIDFRPRPPYIAP
ncbi:hypothetical protein NHG22_24940 [Streptomyces sp. ATE26]|uniref:hypothetical protein n=1 Tax=Streptomyces sp. ATE26 TaxID=2954237 RepID=UPI0024830E73|nr:hypothetical protein [Streptomyces sp. ATE26]MDI1457028.1 hypothetical protein [Streptomyces sp. ATE26]